MGRIEQTYGSSVVGDLRRGFQFSQAYAYHSNARREYSCVCIRTVCTSSLRKLEAEQAAQAKELERATSLRDEAVERASGLEAELEAASSQVIGLRRRRNCCRFGHGGLVRG